MLGGALEKAAAEQQWFVLKGSVAGREYRRQYVEAEVREIEPRNAVGGCGIFERHRGAELEPPVTEHVLDHACASDKAEPCESCHRTTL
jgi:hypothetical protein